MALNSPLRDLCSTCEWADAVKELRGNTAHEVHVCFYNRQEFPSARNCPEFNPVDDLEGQED